MTSWSWFHQLHYTVLVKTLELFDEKSIRVIFITLLIGEGFFIQGIL